MVCYTQLKWDWRQLMSRDRQYDSRCMPFCLPLLIITNYPQELETFLKTEGSETTGFTKSDGSGESIGHESGRKIVDILKRNPDKV